MAGMSLGTNSLILESLTRIRRRHLVYRCTIDVGRANYWFDVTRSTLEKYRSAHPADSFALVLPTKNGGPDEAYVIPFSRLAPIFGRTPPNKDSRTWRAHVVQGRFYFVQSDELDVSDCWAGRPDARSIVESTVFGDEAAVDRALATLAVSPHEAERPPESHRLGQDAVPPMDAEVGTGIGETYRPADEHAAVEGRDPFAVDPEIIERGTLGHAKTQNALAGYLRQQGRSPRSPASDDPAFDLAWVADHIVYVAEVKSVTAANEEKQLRLGLGQVLWYRHKLAQRRRTEVRAVLVAEREPSDPGWVAACEEAGVLLIWPDFRRLHPEQSGSPAPGSAVT